MVQMRLKSYFYAEVLNTLDGFWLEYLFSIGLRFREPSSCLGVEAFLLATVPLWE